MKILGDDDDEWLDDNPPRTTGQQVARLLRKLVRGVARLLLAVVGVLVFVGIFMGLEALPIWLSTLVIVAFLVLVFIFMKGVHKWHRK